MKIKNVLLLTTLGFLSTTASLATASTTNYQYGELLAGSFDPTTVFATLSVSTEDNKSYNFVLKTNDLNTIFTQDAFIGSAAVDTSFAKKEPLPTTALTGNGNGIAKIGTSNGGGPKGVYDFRYVFGQGQDRLKANEMVSWTSVFDTVHLFDEGLFALHIQGLTNGQGGSAWYTPNTEITSAPVPAALPLLASAIGLFGLMANRRHKFSSWVKALTNFIRINILNRVCPVA